MSEGKAHKCVTSSTEDSVDVLRINNSNSTRNKSNDKRELEKPCLPDLPDDSPFLSTKNTRRKDILQNKISLSSQNGGKRKGYVLQSSTIEKATECVSGKKKICLSPNMCHRGITCESSVEDSSDERISTCPVCCQKLPHHSSNHIKQCAEKHHLTLAQVLDGLDLYKKYSKEREALGLPNAPVCLSKRKCVSSKSTATKRNNDPELALGLALSESMRDADEKCLLEQDEILMEAGLGHEVVDRQATLFEKYRFQRSRPILHTNKPPRSRAGKVAKDARPLLIRSAEDRHRLISDKVVTILSSGQNFDLLSIKTESDSVHYKLKSKLLLSLKTNENYLWLKASVDPQNESNVYYVPTLSNFISPENTKLGMRLRHLSQVPCRVLSPKSHMETSNTIVLDEIQSCSVDSPKSSSPVYEQSNNDFHEHTICHSELQNIPSPQLSKQTIHEGVNNSPEELTKLTPPVNGCPSEIKCSSFHSLQNERTEVTLRMFQDWKSMLNNSERSDVIVKGDGYEIDCHELVFYVRCPLILNEIVHQNCQKCIYWRSFRYESVNAFLQYIYCGDISCLSQLSQGSKSEVLYLSKKYILKELENIISSIILPDKVEPNNCHKSSPHLNPERLYSLERNSQITGATVREKCVVKVKENESIPNNLTIPHQVPITLTDRDGELSHCLTFSHDLNPESAKSQNENEQVTYNTISGQSIITKEDIQSDSDAGSICGSDIEHHILGPSSPDPFSEHELIEECPSKTVYRSISSPLTCSPKSEGIACDVSCYKSISSNESEKGSRKQHTPNCDIAENISKCRKKLFEMKVNGIVAETVPEANKNCTSDFTHGNVAYDNLALGSVTNTGDEIVSSSDVSIVNCESSSSPIYLPDSNENAHSENVIKQDSYLIKTNEFCSSMHKLLEDSFLEDLGRSSVLRSSLNPEQTPKNLKDISSFHTFSPTSPEGNVTPMPNYNDMDTPNLQKELSKYGIKRLKRKHAESMLKHIYEELHPVCETECQKKIDSVVDHGMPLQSVAKCLTSLAAQKHLPDGQVDEEVYDSFKPIDLENCKIQSEERILSNCVELENESSEDSAVLEQSKCEKIWNFITTNTDVYQKVLLYDPISIEEFQSALKSETSRPNLNHIMEYLDDQGITFQTKQNNRRKQKKN